MHAIALPPSAASRDAQFVAMLDAFRRSGGLARAEDVASQLRHRLGDSDLQLARWIGRGLVLSFRWEHLHWLPLFQFRWTDSSVHPHVVEVLSELRPVLEPWELAQWFATPNAWLSDRLPADALLADPCAVRDAARADRFLLAG